MSWFVVLGLIGLGIVVGAAGLWVLMWLCFHGVIR